VILKRFINWLKKSDGRKGNREEDPYGQSFNHYRQRVLQTPKKKFFHKLLFGFARLKLFFSPQPSSSESDSQEQLAGQTNRRPVFIVGCTLLIIVLLFGFGNIIKNQLLKLDVFLLKNIRVTGCLKTTPDSIRELSGLSINTPMFTIDLDSLDRRLKKHPWVRKAQIRRRPPDTLFIAIQEYEPKAILRYGEEEELFYIDQDGTPFIEIKSGQNMDFPVITGLEKLDGSLDGKEKIKDVMAFLQKTDEDDPYLPSHSVSQLHIDPVDGTILFLVDFPFPIFLGKDNIQKKYNRLKKVVGFLYNERKKGMNLNKIAYIRMDYADNKVLVAHKGKVDQL